MAFRISDFASSLNRGGVAKSSLFEVRFVPPVMLGTRQTTARELIFRCENIVIPSRALNTKEVNYYGNQRKYVYGSQPPDVTASFIMSEDLIERDFFMDWQDQAVGRSRSTNQVLGGFNIGYYDFYKCDKIEIIKYNEVGDRVQQTNLIDAYPVFIGEVGMSWADDSILKLNVTFTYHRFVDVPISTESRNRNENNQLFDDLNKNNFEIGDPIDRETLRRTLAGENPRQRGPTADDFRNRTDG